LADVPELKHLTEKDMDGYFKLSPKNIDGFVAIQSSYTDNPYLPIHVVNRYRGYGDPNSHLYNLHYYLTAIKGFASTGRKGQILRKVKPISLKNYLTLPFKEFYGQDFGTASPAGMVGVKFDKNNCYCRQLNYKPMNTLEIGKMYCTLKLNKGDKIVADNADEKAWKQLRDGWNVNDLSREDISLYSGLLSGFFVVPCVKGTDSIRDGLSLMDSLNLFMVEESADAWEEINNYIYAVDKYGNYTNEPVDAYNHIIDPWRYVVSDHYKQDKYFGM
ncbi:MAG: hypothetical protein Q8941_24570, partial [Bacteroidota bacterium]|nr:hypothetical protein [Bacteroidota bacterium]